MRRLLGFLIIILTLGTAAVTDATADVDPENLLYMELKDGRVVIEMRPDLAPNHVARVRELVREGFYDGLLFHRVIDGFMAQTGDPDGNGTGGSGQNIRAEFTDLEGFYRGTVGMARAQSPHSADSQFFIMFQRGDFLDGQYTIWAEVKDGMEYVDMIKRGDSRANGTVTDPDKIISMKVAADVKE